jgi:excisionase family DNA binding protein
MTESNLFMTLKEVSGRYNLPLSTLRRWAWERRFPLYKISNKILVSASEFEAYFENFHVKGGGK